MRPSRTSLALAGLTAVALPGAAAAQQPANSWIVSGTAVWHFDARVDTAVAHSGRTSLRLEARGEPRGFATFSTSLPAAPYAGRRIRVSAMLRATQLEGQGAALWARADSGGRSVAFVTTQGRKPLVGDFDWTRGAVELQVPPGAETLHVGALSQGSGRLWIDDARIEPLASTIAGAGGDPDPDAPTRVLGFEAPDQLARPASPAANTGDPNPLEPPRAISPRGLANVVAFARLVGYVRFWYPGDSALATNWDEFTVRGMRLVEQAPTADSLAATLRAAFAAVAPEVKIAREGAVPSARPTAAAGETRHLVFWEHCGFGVPRPDTGAIRRETVYRSTRRWLAPVDGRFPSETIVNECGPARAMPIPDPGRPFIASLGAGLSASIPLALTTTSATGTLTWAPPAAAERFAIADRATRLADVALLWMVPQHFYPYFDALPVDWDAALRRALHRAATDRNAAAFDTTLERLVASLRDGHGGVYRLGVAMGTPDLVLRWIEGRVVVSAVGDSAAAHGARRGDELLSIDGAPVGEALARVESLISGATPQRVREAALMRLLSGPNGSTVTLRLADPFDRTARPRELALVRGGAPRPHAPRPEKIAEVRPGVIYVDLDRVTDADIVAAMPRLQAARGIVFDMRGYPRQVNTVAILAHLADSTIRSPLFELPLVLVPDHASMRFADVSWVVPPLAPRFRARVAFLSGGGAISYAESTLGVVEENKLAVIVGEPSAGTNGNVNPYTLPGGYVVRWTGLRVRKRDGTPHHGVGIIPTVRAAQTLRGVRDGRDDVLARALELVARGEP